jgi:N-acetylglucosaminyldiphosphoundecaprenol N-acetyl-beta-D-mannosaminyltransferase
MTEIHLFEPSGYAGVFQHACRVAQLLRRPGLRVVLHTGHEHEAISAEGVELCPCAWWPRAGARGRLRAPAIAYRLATRTLPHLRRVAGPGSVVHVQGIAAGGPLTLLTLAAVRGGGRRVVYSPHDCFSRRGRLDAALLGAALHVPHAVLVHSRADVRKLRAAGVAARCSPLVQVVPAVDEGRRREWRDWGRGDGESVVLFAGWIRPERRLDMLIESARHWPPGRRLAVVGRDRGAWEACARRARELGVEVSARLGFVELEDFVAALAAADVVVVPHERASQSGVLALSCYLGVPTVAAGVGGLGELATRTFAPGDVGDLTRAIDAQLAAGDGAPVPLDEDLARDIHLRAYGLAGEDEARRVRLMGMPLDALRRDEALARMGEGLAQGRGGAVLTPNLDVLRQYRRSAELHDVFERTELLLADGMPLVWASRLQGTPVPERVTGTDMLWGAAALAAERGGLVFLGGGLPGVADRAAAALGRELPGLRFATYPCYVRPGRLAEQVAGLVAAATAAAPEVVLLGLPFAAQVHAIAALRSNLPATWIVGIGSSFDFLTGDRPRAPAWLQGAGLEWAHRIVHEPRVWRRYLVLGLPFAGRLGLHALARRLRADRGPASGVL